MQESHTYFTTLWKNYERFRSDWISPLCIVILSVMGVLCIRAAQTYTGGGLWKNQLVWVVLGWTTYSLIAMVPYTWYLRYAHFIYASSIIGLFLIWSPLGMRTYGALRWLNLRVCYVQPSELAKVGALVLASSVLARSETSNTAHSVQTILKTMCVFFLPIMLIFLQPDLGSSLIFLPMMVSMLYVSNISKRFMLIALSIAMLIIGLVAVDVYGYHRFLEKNGLSATHNVGAYESKGLLPLKDYQRNRLLSFIAPKVVDPKGLGTSWNLRQSLISIGSGGFLGKGYLSGTQARLGYLPQSVAPNDFIFSVLAEEWGFVGGACIILLYSILIGNGIRIASLSKDRFGTYLAIGITTLFMMHIFINMGMTLGIAPITGISLPFISCGGSFVLNCCVLQGIIQSIYRYRTDFS